MNMNDGAGCVLKDMARQSFVDRPTNQVNPSCLATPGCASGFRLVRCSLLRYSGLYLVFALSVASSSRTRCYISGDVDPQACSNAIKQFAIRAFLAPILAEAFPKSLEHAQLACDGAAEVSRQELLDTYMYSQKNTVVCDHIHGSLHESVLAPTSSVHTGHEPSSNQHILVICAASRQSCQA